MEQDLKGFYALVDSFIHGRKCFPEQGEYPGGNEKRKMLVDTYVITLPESGNHILDIRPVSLLRKKNGKGSFLVLGIARGAMRRQRR